MKKKISSSFINMVGVLFVVTIISATALSSVYNITKEVIAESNLGKQLEALKKAITTDYNNDPVSDKEIVLEAELYPAKKDGELTSLAIKTVSKKGYSGDIEVVTGFSPDGSINKVVVVSQTETPGLGTKVTEDGFLSQFEGKKPSTFKLKVKKDDGDVDAVTGATISSRAVSEAVSKAAESFFLKVEGGFYE